VGNGLDFKVGVFDTVIGYEVADGPYNPNYTRSYGWSIEPTQHTGVLMSYQFNDVISANAGVPVKSNNNDARRGMPNLDPTVELGPQINITLAGSRGADYQLDLQLPVRQVWAVDWPQLHSVGRIFSPMLNLDVRNRWPGQGWRLGLQAGPQFADSDYHGYYYGVDPTYSRPDRPAYSASGGYGGMQGTVSLSRRFDNFWVGAFFRATDLHGAVIDDSPLVRQKTNLMGGLGVSWIFSHSSSFVETNE